MHNSGGVILYRKTSEGSGRAHSWPELAPPAPAAVAAAPEPAHSSASAPSAAPEPSMPPSPSMPPAPAVAAPPAASAAPVIAAPDADPLSLARACANQGLLEEALAACHGAIAADRTRPAAYFLYATICDELGRAEDSIAALGKVLYLDQDFILAHHALGRLYKRLGKHKESARHVAVALELLSAKGRDEIVPESDGMTCGRLAESVRAMTGA